MDHSRSFRILIVSADHFLAEDIYRILSLAREYDTFIANTAEEAEEMAVRLRPDLIVIDTDLPGNGYALCRNLRTLAPVRETPILMLISSANTGARVAALEAGGDDVIVKPFHPDELLYRTKSLLIRRRSGPARLSVPPEIRGRVLAFFGCKGGVGTTTIAVNTAIALHRVTSKPVLLVDADFHFGDVGVQLDLSPPPDISDLLAADTLDSLVVQQSVHRHSSGLHVLLNPATFQDVQEITPDHLVNVLNFLSTIYDYIVVDCHSCYDERNLALLSRADEILLTLTPEISPIRNANTFLHLAEEIGIPPNAIHLVLNRANSNRRISWREVERSLNARVEFWLVSSGHWIVQSLTSGVPMVIGQPSHPFSEQIVQMAKSLAVSTKVA